MIPKNLNTADVLSELRQRGPQRVVVTNDGQAVPPSVAIEKFNIVSDVIFVRGDGWSLGAPLVLEQIAEALWPYEWRYVVRLPEYKLIRYRRKK